jgi:hypothetical protein
VQENGKCLSKIPPIFIFSYQLQQENKNRNLGKCTILNGKNEDSASATSSKTFGKFSIASSRFKKKIDRHDLTIEHLQVKKEINVPKKKIRLDAQIKKE